jgi:hypothetical protein
MSTFAPERRRTRREAIAAESWLSLPSTWPVRLLDLSLGGLAFSSPFNLDPGRTAALRTTLGREAFSGQIRVCWSHRRESAHAGESPYDIGAAFLPLEMGSRRALELFLKVSRSV